jgi:hypothetical protein
MIRQSKVAAAALGLLLVTVVQAGGIGGWGFRIGSVDAHVDLSGVGNPSKKPSITVVDAKLEEISFLCVNPTDKNVAPGSAAERTVSGSDVIDAGNLVGKGQATVDLSFDVPGPFTCVNPNWTYIPHSEVAELLTVSIKWFACTGVDTDPCYDGNELTIAPQPIDSVSGICSVHPVLRNPDGSVVSGQPYDCTQTSP